MEFNDKTQEDVLERLAYTEQLVVELKELIRQKDTELQQKDEVLQVPLFWLFHFLKLKKIFFLILCLFFFLKMYLLLLHTV